MLPFEQDNWYGYNNNTYNPININEYNSMNEIANTNPMADPPPILSNPAPTTALVQRKELTGYANYGNPSGNADILYTGNRGEWTFAIPPFLSAARNRLSRVTLVIRAVLDDHYNVSPNNYSMSVNVNGYVQNFNPVPLEHGRPLGQRFDNWRDLTITIPANRITINNRIIIRNTSRAGANDFIAFDWMEMRYQL